MYNSTAMKGGVIVFRGLAPEWRRPDTLINCGVRMNLPCRGRQVFQPYSRATEDDLLKKMLPLSSMFYGEESWNAFWATLRQV